MEKQDLKEIQRKIGYQFNNIALLFQAFTRKSYSNQFGGENNEVLEFLDDEILDFYVKKYILLIRFVLIFTFYEEML